MPRPRSASVDAQQIHHLSSRIAHKAKRYQLRMRPHLCKDCLSEFLRSLLILEMRQQDHLRANFVRAYCS